MNDTQAPYTQPASLWDQLSTLMLRGNLPPLRIEGAEVLDLQEYLPMVIPQLADECLARAEANRNRWKYFVGYSRQKDIEAVLIPNLIDMLQKFAATGSFSDGLAAVGLVLDTVLRELLRCGRLPVLCPIGELPVSVMNPKVEVGNVMHREESTVCI